MQTLTSKCPDLSKAILGLEYLVSSKKIDDKKTKEILLAIA